MISKTISFIANSHGMFLDIIVSQPLILFRVIHLQQRIFISSQSFLQIADTQPHQYSFAVILGDQVLEQFRSYYHAVVVVIACYVGTLERVEEHLYIFQLWNYKFLDGFFCAFGMQIFDSIWMSDVKCYFDAMIEFFLYLVPWFTSHKHLLIDTAFQRLLVQGSSHGETKTRFRYNFIRFIFFLLFMFGIIQSLWNIFLDELFVLFRIRFWHLVQHLPYIVSHAEIFLIGQAEHVLKLLRNHWCNYEIGVI